MQLVTVVIPTYNRVGRVKDAIKSAQAQTYPATEIVVVVDGSTDGTADALRTMPGIILVEQPNQGLAAARNSGVRAGSGELIAFLDDDDTWRPNKLEVQVPMFDDPTVALVHSGGRLYNKDTGWEAEGYCGDVEFHDLLNYTLPGIQTVVVRRSVFEDVGGFDSTFRGAEDFDFYLRVADRHRLVGTPEILVDVDAIPGLGGDVKIMFECQMRVLDRAVELHPDCATCAPILKHMRRVIRMYGVETEKNRSRRLRAEGKPLHAAWVRIAAYRYDPIALTRLPGRAINGLRQRKPSEGA